MHLTEACRGAVYEKVEDLSARVALIKERLAKQKYSVRLTHYWELERVRSCFAEFKWRVEQLEAEDDYQMRRHDEQALEAAWTELSHALDILLTALPEARALRAGQAGFDVACSGMETSGFHRQRIAVSLRA
jgi:hypothetical protein